MLLKGDALFRSGGRDGRIYDIQAYVARAEGPVV